jgi:hypothetical protein
MVAYGGSMGCDRDAAEVERVIDAARRYRDTLRRYMRGQAALVAERAGLEFLLSTNWERFAAVADLKEELFALLDAIDAAAPG